MAQTIDNIPVTTEEWVDISAISGIAAGTAYTITNEKGNTVLLHESATEPAADEKSGRRLAIFPSPTHFVTIPAGSLKIWAKQLDNKVITGSEINVEVV